MTMPDLFEQLDSPAENGDDWIRRLLSEPDETPSPTPAAGDDGTDRIVPPQASGPGAGGDVTAPPPSGAHAIPLPASDDTSPSDDLDDMHQDAIPGFGTDMDADALARSVHAGRIVLTVLAVVAAVALVGVIAGEFLVSRAGLGYLIVYGGQVFRMDLVMTSVIILAAVAALLYEALVLLERLFGRLFGYVPGEGMEPSGRADFGQREDTRRARRPAVHQGCWIVEGPRGQGQ